MAGTGAYWAIVIILGAMVPGYNPTSTNISALGHGPLGWIQNAGFVTLGLSVAAVGGALFCDFRVTRRGLTRWCAFPLFAVYFILLRLFLDNPPGRYTMHGAVHAIVVAALSLCFPVTAVTLGSELEEMRGSRTFRRFSEMAAGAVLAAVAAWLWQWEAGTQRGLYERVALGIGTFWFVVLAGVHLRCAQGARSTPRGKALQ